MSDSPALFGKIAMLKITKKMMDELPYELPEEASSSLSPPNRLKLDCKLKKIANIELKFEPKMIFERIQILCHTLSVMESEDNGFPVYSAKRQISLALRNFDVSKEISSLEKYRKSKLEIDARWKISIFEVIFSILEAVRIPECRITFLYDTVRERFIHFLIDQVFYTNYENVIEIEGASELYRMNPEYCTMFVFENSDYHEAATAFDSSLNDPTLPWQVRSLYVQESCAEEFLDIVKWKVTHFPKEVLNDVAIVERLNDMEKVAKEIGLPLPDSYRACPCLMREIEREIFDDADKMFAPFVTLKIFRTAKEAVTLAALETGNIASIWSPRHSISYELVDRLNWSIFWINCLGVFEPGTPFKLRPGKFIGMDFTLLDYLADEMNVTSEETEISSKIFDYFKSASKIHNSYHFEYFVDGALENSSYLQSEDPYWNYLYYLTTRWNFKTVVFPFGVTFAN